MLIAANISASHARAFCASLVADTAPLITPCRPLLNKPYNDCFNVVSEQVTSHGGQQIIGWAIWELPGVFIEAEFHAVWQSPEGELLDVVPRVRPFTHISFLPDTSRTYKNRQVDNIRRQLVDDNDVKQFLFLSRRRFEILNAGQRALQHEVLLPKAELRELERNDKLAMRLERRIHKRYESNF